MAIGLLAGMAAASMVPGIVSGLTGGRPITAQDVLAMLAAEATDDGRLDG